MTSSEAPSVGQIMITVDDLARAVAFYRDKLGLELVMSVEAQQMAFLRSGNVRLYLTESDDGPRSRPLIYYRVDELRDLAERLESEGVPVKSAAHVVHRTPASELWMAFFEDPDGLTFALMEEIPLET